ncbi:hypothetical protein BCR42DRAFT_406326, partial [Absidia repens]
MINIGLHYVIQSIVSKNFLANILGKRGSVSIFYCCGQMLCIFMLYDYFFFSKKSLTHNGHTCP